MAAIISTYRHDYVAPPNNRYSFLKKVQFQADPCKEICPCVEEKPRPDLSGLGAKCEGMQWTGPAPAGKPDMPRPVNEPPLLTSEQKPKSCNLDQPNRFLKTISNTYPELYERLKNMPQDELRRSIENSRFRTTYQVDYCHLEEHPAGLYEQQQAKERRDEARYRQAKLDEPCEMFEQNDYNVKNKFGGGFGGDFGGGFGSGGGGAGSGGGGGEEFGKEMNEGEMKVYKPVKAGFTDEGSRGGTAHWDAGAFSKQMTITEYMDTMCRTGLLIMENELHDHSNCRRGRNCNHVIKSKEPKALKLLGNRSN